MRAVRFSTVHVKPSSGRIVVSLLMLYFGIVCFFVGIFRSLKLTKRSNSVFAVLLLHGFYFGVLLNETFYIARDKPLGSGLLLSWSL